MASLVILITDKLLAWITTSETPSSTVVTRGSDLWVSGLRVVWAMDRGQETDLSVGRSCVHWETGLIMVYNWSMVERLTVDYSRLVMLSSTSVSRDSLWTE